MYRHLAGKRCPGAPVSFLGASHYWVAYRRVLELQRIVRRAQRGRGTRPERIAALVNAARCAATDAEWALDRALSPDRTHTLDEAMRRAREEGFELPHARSEPRAFLRMKEFLRRRGFLPARRGRPPAVANPKREPEESASMDLYSYLDAGGPPSRA